MKKVLLSIWMLCGAIAHAQYTGGSSDGDGDATAQEVLFTGATATPTSIVFLSHPNSTMAWRPDVSAMVDVVGSNNLQMGGSVSITISLANNPGSATLGGTATLSSSGGRASFTGLYLDKSGTGYTLQASASSLNSATGNAFDVAQATLILRSQPPTKISTNESFGFLVGVEDGSGNPLPLANPTLNVGIGVNPGSATLSGNVNVLAAGGQVSFSGLGLNNDGLGYVLQVNHPDMASIQTQAFDVFASELYFGGISDGDDQNEVLTRLVSGSPDIVGAIQFVHHPFTSMVGRSDISSEVEVIGSNNLLLSPGIPVTLSLGSNPGGGVLTGSTTNSSNTNARVVFSGLSIDQPGTGYTLNASSGGASAVSNAFDVIAPALATGGNSDGDDVGTYIATSTVSGQTYWIGGLGSSFTAWNDPLNWFPNIAVPDANARIVLEPNNNGHYPVLDQPRIVQSIQFQGANKKVVLGNFNLTLTDTLFGTDANNYVQTNGTGKLVRNLNSGEAFIFPVGDSLYNPVTLTNHTGSADTFSVRVFDAVYANGSSGALIQTPHVKLTWDISKKSGSAAAGQGVDFKFQWNASQESAGMADYVLNHHDGNVWEIPTAMGAPTLIGTTDKFFTVPQYQGTFSPFAIGDSPTSPLPITLSAFTAQCMQGKVTLQWTTAAEINNALFQMERSSDLLDWTLWSTVAGAGHSSTARSYSLTDTERPEGTVYYRLSQVDFDGTTTYFAPVAVSCEGGQTQQVRVYPNPASEMVYVACSGVAADGPGELRLVDMQGRVWLSQEMQWSVGSQTLSLEVSDVPSGVYQIQLWQGDRLWPVMRVVVM